MKSQSTYLAIAFAFGVCSIANADQLIFNLDYGNQRGVATGLAAVGVEDGASASDSWALSTGGFNGAGTLTSPDGGSSAIGAFVAGATSGSGGTFGFGSDPGDELLQDYAFVTDSTAGTEEVGGIVVGAFRRMTIFNNTGVAGGLDASKQYDLYLFGNGDAADQASNFILNQSSGFQNSSNTGLLHDGTNRTLVEGQNLSVFRNVSPTTSGGFTEFEFFLYTTDGGAPAAINGLQLVEITAVPEPATAVLIGLASIGFVSRRRR